MKKMIVIGIISIILLMVIIMIFSFFNSSYYIKKQIEKANYCDTKYDCVDVGGKCPFGCYIYVNIKESEKIRGLVESYESRCVYGCVYCGDVDCVDNTCKPLCEN